MLNITDLQQEQAITPILRLGFRPFFLFGSVFALVAMSCWVLLLTGTIELSPFNGATWWHSHEMLFGFVPAIVAGFLLTAVQTWTSIPSIKGTKLFGLLLVWLTARILLLASPNLSIAIIMAIDLAFLPLTAYFLAAPIIKIKQYRNMIFIPVLLLMTVANALTYLPQFGYSASLSAQGMHSMVLLTTFLVAFLGGRVIPMFTANGTQTPKVMPIKWLEASSLVSLIVLLVFFLSGFTRFSVVLGCLCLISALLNLIRQFRWRPWVTLNAPLVWSLHFSMLFIPVGLTLLGLHFLFGLLSLSTALHSITVGAIGGMIVAMTSRVSLGHTGRVLEVGRTMQLAFIAIILAAYVRSVLVAFWPQYSVELWILSAGLWCVTFACFIACYLPILSAPRVDGRPG
ncbi:NnrS family protein [Aliiglaciecola litoralis]|uniref:NnrS family protein n=1 Tax=Aliiglaciecola litoralis TaxID=582857 RepID=A0ABN1LR27_9ALTE